jgi:phosphoglycerol transferase MdoB-like AlkP superfamily enzyme
MPLPEAVRVAQDVIGQGAAFPYGQYPFVRHTGPAQGIRFERPANVLMIFVEGLDRRFLNQTIQGIRLTPYLDRLREDSMYFEHFFANGVQTTRGLFSTFCSYVPRQGASAMKTQYAHDYLCLPSVLRKAGYRTEMVISEHRDISRLHLFMSRNGLHQLFDQSDFLQDVQPSGKGAGLGRPDGALLDLVRSRIETLQASGRPFFLATKTLGMHHPFAVPLTHPDVRALQSHPDGYVAALKYFDLEFERVLSGLKRDGLLKNTVVFILGDHGRHEKVGGTDVEKQAGHFMAPLLIWIDDTLRTPQTYRPGTVSTVASQVDLVPTILALNGLTPRLSPWQGRDLTCALISDCLKDNVAFLSSVYDDLIGLADHDGLLLYSLRTKGLYTTDLDAREPVVRHAVADAAIVLKYRRALALYISSNVLLNQNRIWSWKELGPKL